MTAGVTGPGVTDCVVPSGVTRGFGGVPCSVNGGVGSFASVTSQCVQTDLHTKGLCLQFGQVVGVVLQLPPQVGILLTKNLHLEGQLIIGSHSIGHLHTVRYPLQEDK